MRLPISPRRLARHLLGAVVPTALLLGMATAALAQGGGATPSAPPPAASAAGSQAPIAPSPPASPAGSAVAPAVPAATAPPPPPTTAAPAPIAPPPVQPPPPPQYAAPLPAVAAPTTFSAAGGRVILSADRLFGISSWSETASSDAANVHIEAEASGTMVNLLWSNSANGGGSDINPFAMPRLSLDAFVGTNVTLGGSIGYLSTSGSRKTPTFVVPISGNTLQVQYDTKDDPDFSAFIIQPRLGVAIPIGERAAIWLRGGITYFHSTAESTQTTTGGTVNNPTTITSTRTSTSNGTALSLDPVIVFLPVPHVGLTIGPAIDIGLDGSFESTQSPSPPMTTPSTPIDLKMSNYGAAAGLLVFF